MRCPAIPYRGTREIDGYGAGGYGAPRDGGKRKHVGLDLATTPGDLVVSTISGLIKRIGDPYGDGKLHTIHIEGPDGWYEKLFYVKPTLSAGNVVAAGVVVGIAEDLTAYYAAKYPKNKHKITNHIHWEVLRNGEHVDPTTLLEV